VSSFDARAKEWDTKDVRVNGAKTIADAITKNVTLSQDMELMDFGVGTGLLGFELVNKVKNIDGVDTSAGMLEKLQQKNSDSLHITPIHQDILKKPLNKNYDGIISSMTLHHIENIEHFFQMMHKLLKPSGFIAIADLEEEDGSFHSDNSGVFHFGFKKERLEKTVQKAGFKNIKIETINTISKEHRDFTIFLLTAQK
jgi:predicted TPR repeat methyltransferase